MPNMLLISCMVKTAEVKSSLHFFVVQKSFACEVDLEQLFS